MYESFYLFVILKPDPILCKVPWALYALKKPNILTLISQDTDLRFLSLSSFLSSTPLTALYSVSPVPLPNASHNTPLLFSLSSPNLVTPSFSNAFCFADRPNPCRSDISKGTRNSSTRAGRRWYEPAGLARRVAKRERSMLCAIPMLTANIVRTKTTNNSNAYLRIQ